MTLLWLGAGVAGDVVRPDGSTQAERHDRAFVAYSTATRGEILLQEHLPGHEFGPPPPGECRGGPLEQGAQVLSCRLVTRRSTRDGVRLRKVRAGADAGPGVAAGLGDVAVFAHIGGLAGQLAARAVHALAVQGYCPVAGPALRRAEVEHANSFAAPLVDPLITLATW